MIKSLNKRPNSLTAFRANWAIRKSALDQRILIGKKVARNWLKHLRSFAQKRVEQQDSKKSPIESFSLLAVTFAMALPLRSDYVNGFVHQPSLSGPPVDLIENCYSRPLSLSFQPDLLIFHTAAYTIDRSPSYATRRPAITESIVSTRRPGFCRPKVKLILFSAFERSLQKFRFHARRFVCKTSFSECSVFFFSSFAALGENTKSLGERKHLIFTFPSFVQRFFRVFVLLSDSNCA